MDNTNNYYFAAANSTNGFVSYYTDIFSKADEIYVIKGGPGTGKSRLMREIGRAAEQKHRSVEYFRCSFAPDSLDGIMIDNQIAVLDGTAPHLFEPRIPGAKDRIVDLGAFWDERILASNRKSLEDLTILKKQYFDLAYLYLSSLGYIINASKEIGTSCINRDVLQTIDSRRVAESHIKTPDFRIRSAFGSRGLCVSESYENSASSTLYISDALGTFAIGDAMRSMMNRLNNRGDLIKYSFSPFEKDTPDALMLSDGTVILKAAENGNYDISEFMSAKINDYKSMLMENREISKTLLSCAEKQFSLAAEIHFQIEEIYISSMNFKGKEDCTASLISKILA